MFKLAQTFFVDKDAVKGATIVRLTSVVVYVKGKPLDKNNKSGIERPSLSAQIVRCRADGTPDFSSQVPNGLTTLEYNEIVASADASAETKFDFKKPVLLNTDAKYALVMVADGDEDYTFWTCKEGEYILGTSTKTSGATAKHVGDLFEYTTSVELNLPQSVSGATWKPLKNVDLKFQVNIAVFEDIDPGTITQNNANTYELGVSYVLPNEPYEFMAFDRYGFSAAEGESLESMHGRKVYQETPVQYGTLTVAAANNIVRASNNINFNTLIDTENASRPHIVITNPSDNTSLICQVIDVMNNTTIMIDTKPGFSSNTATFQISPVAYVYRIEPYWYSGKWWNGTSHETLSQKAVNIALLGKSNANSSVRFVNNYITGVSIDAAGAGYSNTDYVEVHSGVSGSLNATANIVTSNSGGIVSISIANAGYGHTNTISYTVYDANNDPTTGTGATLTFTAGQKIRTESPSPNAVFSNVVFDNFEAHKLVPNFDIVKTIYETVDVFQHFSYYVYPGAENTIIKANTAVRVRLEDDEQMAPIQHNDGRIWIVPSRSNEAVFSNVAILKTDPIAGTTSNTDIGSTSGSITEIVSVSNNVFSVPTIRTPDIAMSQYVINDSASNEIKNNGSALAKHVSSKVYFTEDRKAEDIRIVIKAYRPANTEIKVYAKIHNSEDPDAFDDKDWSILRVTSNNEHQVSKLGDESDLIEFHYGFRPSPNTFLTANAASIITTLSSNNITGTTGTDFTNEFQASDLVKISSPLFQNTHMITTVQAVTNSSQIVLNDAVSNSSLVGNNMVLELIGRAANGANAEYGQPHQAFNNIQNDNVVRYYNSSMTEFDTYDSFAIKIVELSSQRNIVPKVASIRGVGVST